MFESTVTKVPLLQEEEEEEEEAVASAATRGADISILGVELYEYSTRRRTPYYYVRSYGLHVVSR